MPPRPYDSASVDDGDLCFQAELPAFTRIGRHYAVVEDARLDYTYAQADLDRWSAYVDAIQVLAAAVKSEPGRARAIVAEFHRDHPPCGDVALDRLPGRMLETAPITLTYPAYLDVLAQSARMTLIVRNMRHPDPNQRMLGPGALRPHREKLQRDRAAWLPSGRFWFCCGPVAEVSPGQKQLFDDLEANQGVLFERLAEKMREMHAFYARQVDQNDPQEQVVYPIDAPADAPLDRFRINCFRLVDGKGIAIVFDSLIEWCDEHGCVATIRHGRVAIGGSDEFWNLEWDDEDDGDEDRDDWGE